MSGPRSPSRHFDVVVVGAGFSGLYQLYRARQLGLHAKVFEAGSGVGGTWYWNRYPGARCDSQAYIYQYWFSDDLLGEWDWSERFPTQPETERYLNRVADKFDLKRDIEFDSRITAAHFDEASQRWQITTRHGETVSAQFLVMASGGLSAPHWPRIPSQESFEGIAVHTGLWPKEGIELAGKRVGVIGTGATGIQVVQASREIVGHLTVFQRTPNYTIPMRNPRYDDAARAELRARYPELRHRVHDTFAGFDYDFDERSFHEVSPAERERKLEELWEDGSLNFWIGSFKELFFEQDVNDVFSEFVRERIRARVDDPRTAEKLVPKDHGFGTRRVPLEWHYYEAYNQDNVELVDMRETPIHRLTRKGVETSERLHELDVLIYATGFDAGTGALTRIDLRGQGGLLLKDAWASSGLRTCLGLQVHGYPNMFMTMGPMSPAAAFCNVPTCSQQQVDWITDTIAHVREKGCRSIQPSAELESWWVAHHDEVANETLVPKTKSWYMGTNVEGKERRLLVYAGGVPAYRRHCEQVKESGYRGFEVA